MRQRLGWLAAAALVLGACGDDDGGTADAPIDTDSAIPDAGVPDALSGFALSVTVNGGGGGSVTSDPAGIDCPGDCLAGYEQGTEVTLTAVAGAGASFEAWGGDCAETEATDPCVLTMDGDKSVAVSLVGGAVTEATAHGGTGLDWASAVAVDSTGARVVAGYFSGTVDFGDGDVDATGLTDLFVAKYEASGDLAWVRTAGSIDAYGFANSVAVDGDDNVLVAGQFEGTITLGGAADELSAVLSDVVVAKLSSEGGHVWSRQYGGTGADAAYWIAVDADGNAVVTGNFEGTADLGGDELIADGPADIFLAKYDAGGDHAWSFNYGGPDEDFPFGAHVSTAADGSVYYAGWFTGTVDFGGDPIQSEGNEDIVVARYDADGGHVWSRGFGSAGNDEGTGVVAVDGGDAILVAVASGAIDFGDGEQSGGGAADLAVARLAAADGDVVWSSVVGGPGDELPWAVARNAGGDVAICGVANGAMANLGGDDFSTTGGDDAFVARYGADGGFVWGRSYGGVVDEIGTDVAFAADGQSIVLTGVYNGETRFGSQLFGSEGEFDFFLVDLGR